MGTYLLGDVSVPRRSAGVIRYTARIREFIWPDIVKQVEQAIDVLYRGEASAEALNTLKTLSGEKTGLYKTLRNSTEATSNVVNEEVDGQSEDGRQKRRKRATEPPTSVS